MASQRVTSLRRRAQTSAPTASYWLGRVLDDAGRQDKTSTLCKGCRAAEPTMHLSLVWTLDRELVVCSSVSSFILIGA